MSIKIQPMEWCSNGETEAKMYRNVTLPGAWMVENTRKNINDVLKYVFIYLFFVLFYCPRGHGPIIDFTYVRFLCYTTPCDCLMHLGRRAPSARSPQDPT